MFYLIWPPFCFPIQLWSLAPEIFFSSPTRLHPPKLLSCALWNVQLILKHCPVCFTLLPWHIPGCFPVRLFPLKSPRVRLFYSSFPKQRNSESAVENTVFCCFQTIFQQLSSKKKKKNMQIFKIHDIKPLAFFSCGLGSTWWLAIESTLT